MHADSWALKAKKLGFRSRAVFKLEEISDVGVSVRKAKGEKCSRCWKIVPSVKDNKCPRCLKIK